MNYKSGSPKYGRREFFKRALAGTGALMLGGSKTLYADDLVEDIKILEKFGKIYAKVKDKGFPYKMSVDVNDDGINDNFVFTLKKGSSVTVGTNATSGTRFTMEFTKLSGGWEGTKIYGIVGSNNEIKIAKRKWLTSANAKTYLDAVFDDLEKKD